MGWRDFVGDAGRNHDFGGSAAYTVLYAQFRLIRSSAT
jgi:hypothetical protein